VTCLAFTNELLVSACSQSVIKLWDMDDLKCMRTLRGHEGLITGGASSRRGLVAWVVRMSPSSL
jgi:WD40 repeat protein